MQRMKNTALRIWPAFAAMVVVVGVVSAALAQGSGSRDQEPMDPVKVEVKAELNAQALKAIMDANVPVVLLDARGPSNQWIDGAAPLDYDADEKAIRGAVSSPNQLIVTYCGGPDCIMSLMLANNLVKHGYTNVIRFTGGIEAWTKAGFELKTKSDAQGSDTKTPSGSSAKPSGSGTY